MVKHQRVDSRVLTWIAVWGLFLPEAATYAAEVLDQQYVFGTGIGDTGSSAQEVGQTFSVGVAGTLSRVEVYMARVGIDQFNTDQALFSLYDTDLVTGLPTAELGHASASSLGIPTMGQAFVSFDLTAFAIPVQVDKVLAFGVHSSGSELYVLPANLNDNQNPYTRGIGVRRTLSNPPGAWTFQTGKDYGFKTYVNVAASTLLGDYNGNHTIDAADYTVWHDLIGAPAGSLTNDSTPAAVDDADFMYWKDHFGQSMGSGGNSLQTFAVPEPNAASIAVFAVIGLALLINTRR